MASNTSQLQFNDVSEERGFYKKFINLPNKSKNTLRIVDKGEYYTIIGHDALFVADNIYHTQSALKTCHLDTITTRSFKEKNELDKYLTVSPQILSNLIQICLLELGYKLEIYDKLWNLLKSASPGNIEPVEDLIKQSSDTTNLNNAGSIVIASLKISFNSNTDNNNIISTSSSSSSNFYDMALSFVDSTNGKIGMLQCNDNEIFSNLESFIIQLGVKELLLPDNLEQNGNDFKKLSNMLDRCNVIITLANATDYNNRHLETVESNLTKLANNKLSLTLPQTYTKPAMCSCHALLNYLKLMDNETNLDNFELVQYSLKEFMKLDSSSIKSLNLFPREPIQLTSTTNGNFGSVSNTKSKINSLYQLLNYCKTNMGARLLNDWIKQPLTDLNKINKRHDLVEYLMDQIELRQLLQNDYLPLIPDMRRLIKKLLKNGNLEDVMKIFEFTKRIPEIIELLQSFVTEGDNNNNDNLKSLIEETWLHPLEQHLEPIAKFQEMIESTIDLESYYENNDYMIRVEFNEELSTIKQELNILRENIKSIHMETADDLGFDPEKKLKLENHHLHGWCMRLTRNDAKTLRNNKKYIELSTVKAGIFFSTRQLREISQKTAALEKDYERQQSSVVKEIVQITLTYNPVMEKLSHVLANLDVLNSFAHVSSYAPIQYIRPNMFALDAEERRTKLLGSRHPVLEMQDDLIFISNDVDMEKNESEFFIITGPNMGGKSTYIRQVGVITLMAQLGCFVPCEEADIAIVDAILCRVGAGDSQLKGASTFMIEMLETASILKNATSNSLIIIDELGRGTSTYDGFGLAWSIANYIASNIKCFTLFATHFHEITKLTNKVPTVKNLHVVAHIEEGEKSQHDSNDITLLYKVEPGISDQSFGIHVAEVVQFPQKIINMAKRKADELEDLKLANEHVKRTKLSIDEINSGNKQVLDILRKWIKQVKDEGLDSDENINDEKIQEKVQDLLKQITNDSMKENSKYLEYIKTLLL